MIALFREGSLVPMLGVDFGTHTVKGVMLTGRSGKFVIEGAADGAMPRGVLVDYQLQDIEKVGHVLKGLRRSLPTAGQFAATAVTGSNVISKVLLLDAGLSDAEFNAQVMQEAEQLIPFPLDEISLDYEVLGLSSNDPERQEVLLSAARTESISGRVSALAEAGFVTKVMDVGAHALGRAVVACYPQLIESNKATAIVDIGASALTFATMVRGEVIYSRLQNFGGDQYTQALSSFYGMTLEEAEQAKLTRNLPAGHDQDVTEPHLATLLQHIKRNTQLFCSSSGFRDISDLVLTGGASLVAGLPAYLARELEIEVLHPDPFAEFGSQQIKELGHGARYMTAFGLALRSFTPCQI